MAENSTYTQGGSEPERNPASNGRDTLTATCRLLHSTPARWWWRAGGLNPVSTATLGLIHRADPSLAAQLRKDPASLAVHTTRLRVYSTMRLIHTGMLGQLASLQQWEEAMHLQDEQ